MLNKIIEKIKPILKRNFHDNFLTGFIVGLFTMLTFLTATGNL